MIYSTGHPDNVVASTVFRGIKKIQAFQQQLHVHGLLFNAHPAPLGIKQTVKAREGTDRLLQMESFKAGKDHSLISIYQIQQTTL